MSKKNNSKYKEDIKNGFNLFEPENNGFIETKQLSSISKVMNLNKKNPFIFNSINSLNSKKIEENEEGGEMELSEKDRRKLEKERRKR